MGGCHMVDRCSISQAPALRMVALCVIGVKNGVQLNLLEHESESDQSLYQSYVSWSLVKFDNDAF
jgi:hypothetical protein